MEFHRDLGPVLFTTYMFQLGDILRHVNAVAMPMINKFV